MCVYLLDRTTPHDFRPGYCEIATFIYYNDKHIRTRFIKGTRLLHATLRLWTCPPRNSTSSRYLSDVVGSNLTRIASTPRL